VVVVARLLYAPLDFLMLAWQPLIYPMVSSGTELSHYHVSFSVVDNNSSNTTTSAIQVGSHYLSNKIYYLLIKFGGVNVRRIVKLNQKQLAKFGE